MIMKRIIFITTFTALTLGLVFITGCPRPICKRGALPKVITFNYPDLSCSKVDSSYRVTIIITQRNNETQIIDTISKNIYCDTMQNLSFAAYFEGINNNMAQRYNDIIDLPEDSWKPNNIIVIIDSTKYRDTLTNIVFYNDPNKTCTPEDAIAVSFYHNGKYVYLDGAMILEIK